MNSLSMKGINKYNIGIPSLFIRYSMKNFGLLNSKYSNTSSIYNGSLMKLNILNSYFLDVNTLNVNSELNMNDTFVSENTIEKVNNMVLLNKPFELNKSEEKFEDLNIPEIEFLGKKKKMAKKKRAKRKYDRDINVRYR